jgi:inosine-uridine nucleoside N-ribohydrolase
MLRPEFLFAAQALFVAFSAVAAPKPVVLDVDPGTDDALAILLAVDSEELDVRAVTVVAGNVGVDLGSENALKVLALAGRSDIPVARGAAVPLLDKPLDSKYVHGANGLGDIELPASPAKLYPGNAIDLIAKVLRESDEPVTLVPVGPLTNVALFLEVHPELVPRIRELVIMGGTASVGTIRPTVSFNIFHDPEAAAIVFGSGLPITMVGSNVTLRTVLTPRHTALIVENDNAVSRFISEIVRFHQRVRSLAPLKHEEGAGIAMHDPLAVGVAIDPSFVRVERAHVSVELQGSLTRGQTVVDTRDYWYRVVEDGELRRAEREPQAEGTTNVAMDVDAERFLSFFVERMRSR